MNLQDLDPRWALDADIVIGGVSKHFPDRGAMGLSFECPHCVALEQRAGVSWPRGLREHDSQRVIRLVVWFANPVDGGLPTDDATTLWQRTGETFETLTLSPSIDASHFGHWHGFIRNGVIE